MWQFRKDPLSDRWVVCAEARDERPNEYPGNGRRRANSRCPFCAGHEADTPPEIVSYRAENTTEAPSCPDWVVRVVPNKFPAFCPEGDPAVMEQGMYAGAQPVGAQEVIVESPRHVASLTQLTDEEVALVLRAYRDRMLAWRRGGRYRYVLIFKNVGPRAGASLEHAHSQLIAMPMVPGEVAREVAAAEHLYHQHQDCFFCRVIRDEQTRRRRWVDESDRFLATCPYASRMPYEMWILPRTHAARFEDEANEGLAELAIFLREMLRKLESLHGDLAYNYFIHTIPFDTISSCHYHWHIEIFPRLTTTAGFEWGAGCYINPVPPEQAAATLRSGTRDRC